MRLQTFLAVQGPLIRRSSLTRADQRSLQSADAAGLVTRLLPGVYAVGEGADDLGIRASAVALWHPDAVITGRAAARFTFWPTLPVTRIDVARDARPPRSRGYRFEQRAIDPGHIIETKALRLTAPALTAIDLVDELGGDGIDTCLRSRAARLDDLWAAFAAHPSRPGNRARRRMLLDSRDQPWSAAERLAHCLLHAARITGWSANYRVVVSGACYFIDIAFPAVRLAVEIDGRLHEDDPGIFETDRYRSNNLVSAGWTVLRFTYAMLVTRPGYVIATITAELARLQRAARK
jgi:very-short-patch-repair endonuclease